MRTILFLLYKEITQIFRDKFLGKAIFAVPVVQMLILVPAVTFELKNVNLCIIDRDLSAESRELTRRLEGSGFFNVTFSTFSEKEANNILHKDASDLIIHIPAGFGNKIGKGGPGNLLVSANAINPANAQLSWAYLNGVIRDFTDDVMKGKKFKIQGKSSGVVQITNRYWYNEMLNYKFYMLPGILGILVLAIGFILAGLNLVKEKESGTMEQINVSPVKKYQLISAKIIPFLVIGLIDIALGLAIGKIAFKIPFEGSITLLFFCSAIYLLAALGLAIFVSTFSATQQQFMFTAFFFMIIFILMSGIFTPLESMPEWAQKINLINPVTYIMRINRMIMLKGTGFQEIRSEISALSLIALVSVTLAVYRYRKTV